MSNSPASWRADWQRDGFLVLRNVVPPADIALLRAICDRVREQWRADSTPDSEPGGFAFGPKAWVLIHLNHPRYHRGRRDELLTLLNAIAHPLGLAVLKSIYGADPLFMQMNYYMDPAGEGWPGVWHRDCQFFAGGDEKRVLELLLNEADPPRDVHMHIPLIQTQATEVVPGSHKRDDTPEERHVRLHDSSSANMPNALALALNPGDLAFFHVNTVHRGMYTHGVPRRTIAITYSNSAHPRPPTREWMISSRGYAASYQPWFLRPGYLDGLGAEARAFFQRYLDAYGARLTPDLLVPELGEARISYYTAA
jgi:Phytanoyl-CoA dioxygenase (PhyH)